MHTVKILLAGVVLLGICLLVGRWIGGGSRTVLSTAVKSFLVLWLIATLGNLWFGVSKAGYSIREEAPWLYWSSEYPQSLRLLFGGKLLSQADDRRRSATRQI